MISLLFTFATESALVDYYVRRDVHVWRMAGSSSLHYIPVCGVGNLAHPLLDEM